MIEIKDLILDYPCTKLIPLHNRHREINISINHGEIIALLGRNGAGKTTFMKVLTGINPCAKGSLLLDGHPITFKDSPRIAFGTCEFSFFPGLTPAQHRDFYRTQYDLFRDDRFEMLMKFFQLPANRKLSTFSTGQKAQFETILALSQGADYIFLDEPCASSDIFIREDFYKLLLGILNPNETLMLSTHLIDDIKTFAGRILLMDDGRIIEDIETSELDEAGINLVDWVKEKCNWDNSKVIKTLSEL